MLYNEVDTKILEKEYEDTVLSLISPFEKEELYHYTDSNGLLSILLNNELWLTERKYFNDMNESNHPNQYFEKYKMSIPTFESYIFSLSQLRDKSNLWSFYSKSNGFCLVFDLSKLIDYFASYIPGEEITFCGPVIYDNIIKNKITEELSKIQIKYNISPDCKWIKEKIALLHTMFKEIESINESEYRFVTLLKHRKFPFVYKEHRIKGKLITPFCKIKRIPLPIKFKTQNLLTIDETYEKAKLDELNTMIRRKLPITEIIMGPDINDPMAEVGLRDFLDSNGYNDVRISKSNSSVRLR